MKTVFSIILASLILFFSAGFKVATHYCGNVAVSSTISASGVAEGCGMETTEKSSCNSDTPLATQKSCCKDEVLSFQIDDDYQPVETYKNTVNFDFLVAFVTVFSRLDQGYKKTDFNTEYSPPIIHQDLLVEHQVFLI